MPSNLPVGFVPEPPRKNRVGLVFASIFALLVLAGGGFAAYWFLQQKPTGQSPGSTFTRGDLHVGNYWLVNACNVFTAKDFDDVMGRRTNHAYVSTDFTAQTYNDAQPDRSYRSGCTRLDAPSTAAGSLSADVIIHQYPNTQRTDVQLFLFALDKAAVDPEFDGRARFRMPSFHFESGNKLVTVLIQGYSGMSDSDVEVKARAIAQKISVKLRDANQKQFSVFSYPATFQAPGFTYQNACTLWGPDDFTALYGEADAAEIKMDFAEDIEQAEEVQGIDQSTKTKCTIGSYTVDPGDLAGKDYAYVEVDYYRTKEAAAAAYAEYAGPDDEQLSGIGDVAILQQKQRIVTQRGATMVRVQFIPNDMSEKTKVEAGVRAMAQTILDRLRR